MKKLYKYEELSSEAKEYVKEYREGFWGGLLEVEEEQPAEDYYLYNEEGCIICEASTGYTAYGFDTNSMKIYK
ncbi:hypothetical protein EGK75_09205 [Neisseria weixii]|uniref:Uncharacterized protein n=1 Tax=Neisseria weixii TaxID=1853276 RepID=A0A3N4MZF8_9NEIS|nr:hypothetical protein [Neisseria weixii]RPD86288.1 hypothetical protein EGK75_09205 [Neisseria weixii]RPD89392.1 hypothetical protein EGK74_04010 [Neisseria weixii]